MNRGWCAVCPQKAVQQHHIVYRQHLPERPMHEKDSRNLIPLCKRCHDAHHDRTVVLSTGLFLNEVFEFAREVLGAGPAQAYFERYYQAGDDQRVRALWSREAAA